MVRPAVGHDRVVNTARMVQVSRLNLSIIAGQGNNLKRLTNRGCPKYETGQHRFHCFNFQASSGYLFPQA